MYRAAILRKIAVRPGKGRFGDGSEPNPAVVPKYNGGALK